MFNNQLTNQLKKAIDTGALKPKYPDGYKAWKEKFDYFYNITKDVEQTLNAIYGPGGSVTSYQGSIYRNSNLDITKAIAVTKPVVKQHFVKKPGSKSLAYINFKKSK
jgi:hypothetical protein